MPKAWSAKRERQYEHIKEGLEDSGRSEDAAEEIAARTVNKERARAGESKESSRTSTEDISSGRRGGLRSHSGPAGRTRDQLYQEARDKGVKGRSKMNKAQLERAVDRREVPREHRLAAILPGQEAREGTRDRSTQDAADADRLRRSEPAAVDRARDRRKRRVRHLVP